MPSAKKNRRKHTGIKTNKKKLWKNLKKKKNVHISCDQVRGAWDSTKTVQQNLSEMGIALDANTALPAPARPFAPKLIIEEKKTVVTKPEVVKEMEIEANLGEQKKPLQLPSEDVHFCTYMLDKYKDKYKEMARDSKNIFQLTPKQIRSKLREFKRAKGQYEKYLKQKNELDKTEFMEIS